MVAKARRRKRTLAPSDWENLSDEEVLRLRIRDLGLKIEASVLHGCIERLYEELAQHGLGFRPPCYLADEWFCPDKMPIIGIPFCLAHPRLKQIEQKRMYEVEGGSDAACMRLLRHECGHAINYAYRLYNRTRWRELFGYFSDAYMSAYHFEPYSRRFVVHLKDNYAQAHPDEDFAETFAVWLTPDSDWREKYIDWPVIGKIEYVDGLMKRIGEQPPLNTMRQTPYAAARMTSTLHAFYERKREYMGEEFPGYYDDSLKTLFVPGADSPKAVRASRVLRQYRRQVVSSVTIWTGQRKYDIHQLVNRLIKRCDALDLRAHRSELETVVDVTALIGAIVNRAFRFDTAAGPAAGR